MTVEAMIAEGYTLAIRLLTEETNLEALNGLRTTGARAVRHDGPYRGPASYCGHADLSKACALFERDRRVNVPHYSPNRVVEAFPGAPKVKGTIPVANFLTLTWA
jgi:hypothetical protein